MLALLIPDRGSPTLREVPDSCRYNYYSMAHLRAFSRAECDVPEKIDFDMQTFRWKTFWMRGHGQAALDIFEEVDGRAPLSEPVLPPQRRAIELTGKL